MYQYQHSSCVMSFWAVSLPLDGSCLATAAGVYLYEVNATEVGLAGAENLAGVDKMICAAGHAQICLETGDCYSTTPWELAMPDFVVIDLKKKTISTTRASQLNRATEFTGVEKTDGVIFLQGIEYGRAFSFVIDEATGRMSVAVSLDGMSVTVFGTCTDTDIK